LNKDEAEIGRGRYVPGGGAVVRIEAGVGAAVAIRLAAATTDLSDPRGLVHDPGRPAPDPHVGGLGEELRPPHLAEVPSRRRLLERSTGMPRAGCRLQLRGGMGGARPALLHVR
jgi:hypothetical protein